MDFNQIMNNIFGAEWLGTITQILSGVVMVVISGISAKLKNKLINSKSEYAQTIGRMLDANNLINTKLSEQQELNNELQHKQEVTTEAVTNLVNIVGMGFLDSKGVTAETKLAISNVIGKLQTVGVNLEQVNKTVEQTAKTAELAVETVNKIKEETNNVAETANKAAEGIATATVDVYEKIINEQ